jgi:hypothetical protein
MNKIDEKELLETLGYGDPPHSMQWYKENFPDLPVILKRLIIDSLNFDNTFPKGLSQLEKRTKYQNYYILIEKENDKYKVRITNTDRGEISKEKEFKNANDAANYLIFNSYSCGGSIKSYWKPNL